MSSQQQLLVSRAEAAEILGLTKPQLYELTRSRSRIVHKLPVVRIGKRLCFRRESLERWIAELESSAAEVR
jgi:excisionase family DNA binding protein